MLLTDIDECTTSTDNCHKNATCTNTDGSFTCECHNGYAGNGSSCTGNADDTMLPRLHFTTITQHSENIRF